MQSLPHRRADFNEIQSSNGRDKGAAGDAEHCGPLLRGEQQNLSTLNKEREEEQGGREEEREQAKGKQGREERGNTGPPGTRQTPSEVVVLRCGTREREALPLPMS